MVGLQLLHFGLLYGVYDRGRVYSTIGYLSRVFLRSHHKLTTSQNFTPKQISAHMTESCPRSFNQPSTITYTSDICWSPVSVTSTCFNMTHINKSYELCVLSLVTDPQQMKISTLVCYTATKTQLNGTELSIHSGRSSRTGLNKRLG